MSNIIITEIDLDKITATVTNEFVKGFIAAGGQVEDEEVVEYDDYTVKFVKLKSQWFRVFWIDLSCE